MPSRSLGPFGYCPEQRKNESRPAHPQSLTIGYGFAFFRRGKPYKNRAIGQIVFYQSRRVTSSTFIIGRVCYLQPYSRNIFSNARRHEMANDFFVGVEKKVI